MLSKTPAVLFGVLALIANFVPASATASATEISPPEPPALTSPSVSLATQQLTNSSLSQKATLDTTPLLSAYTPEPEPVKVVPPQPAATKTTQPEKTTTSVPNVTPNPGSAQQIAFDMLAAQGLGQSEFNCLVSLWNKESGWRVNAANPSGAYGIPQALPGSKMASAGADWKTNPATQIKWGLGYISSRYGTPCGAFAASQQKGWY